MFAPSQVYSFGNVPLSVNAVLLKVNGVLVLVIAVIESFLQERNTEIEAMKKRFFIILIINFRLKAF